VTHSSEAIATGLIASFERAEEHQRPYRHLFLDGSLPAEVVEEIAGLPFAAPDLAGLSGKRELHNGTRTYFDAPNRAAHPVCAAVAEAFQSPRVVSYIEDKLGTGLTGTYLRIEYAQDTDGFWLEPHSDLGVKLFTMLLYVSADADHRDLGTDIYHADKRHAGRSPFAPGAAMVFVPGNDTFHGFERRPITGVRKSVIINYVTDEWRAREQLAFPETPIG
jgi:hypothetical protein